MLYKSEAVCQKATMISIDKLLHNLSPAYAGNWIKTPADDFLWDKESEDGAASIQPSYGFHHSD